MSKILILLGCLLATPLLLRAQIGSKSIYYGVSYYPEAWDSSYVARDIERMKELNINVVRMAEFAWTKMEPVEGRYDFGWLHQIIDKLDKARIDVILGTPTATPPNWMWTKYPEIALTDVDGRRTTPGLRRECSFTNPVYHQKSIQIAAKLAAECERHKNVIGYQIDNEFSIVYDYSPATKARWVTWLQNRYGKIEVINTKWGLELWSQAFDSFDQVPMPDMDKWYHPSLKLAWQRFSSDLVVDFCNAQTQAMRPFTKKPITHDGMPSQKLDYDKLFHDLDFVAVNNYHSFEAYELIISNYDRVRCMKQRPYWLFETAPNYSGGGNNGSTWFLHMPEGSLGAALWMNYALGGQGAMYWLWRQQKSGQEMTHGAVLQSWDRPAANYDDIGKLGKDLQTQAKWLTDNPVPKPKLAIVYSYTNAIGLANEKYANDLAYYQDFTYRFYLPLVHRQLHRDVISLDADLSDYKVIAMPLCPLITIEQRQRLKAFVENGGTLILGPMSGYRNEEWAAYEKSALGDLEQWAGIKTESRLVLGAKPREAEPAYYIKFARETDSSRCYLIADNYSLTGKEGKVVATYGKGMLNNQPAVVERTIGKGKVVFLGTDPGQQAFGKLVEDYCRMAGTAPIAVAEAGILTVPRGSSGSVIAINLTNSEKFISPAGKKKNRLNLKLIEGKYKMKPYEVLLLD